MRRERASLFTTSAETLSYHLAGLEQELRARPRGSPLSLCSVHAPCKGTGAERRGVRAPRERGVVSLAHRSPRIISIEYVMCRCV